MRRLVNASEGVTYSNPKNLRHQEALRSGLRCTLVSRSSRSDGVSVPSVVSETVSGPCGSSRGAPAFLLP